ncbi:unnamed protein product [Periconia digitata]|uniref:Uncharacterized protein n=1 Tax=Periconia digitata TaxID=1303443 RepID=A0A9W4UM90_9PLEO|nr:unnamed protein product [Periconia digitata]
MVLGLMCNKTYIKNSLTSLDWGMYNWEVVGVIVKSHPDSFLVSLSGEKLFPGTRHTILRSF